ncbi:Rossmann-like and DUF2520 domain-containing protein [Euzebya tangerina]|uniref:Rossmann-like and DUF2520 domain-containing protein n=1 Tax=Euzebya tangerina TaxID=591198 RepID=UPI000E31D065|nr:Rossmann-like and DUF2520 domain-containing protein [Euzebya tangerina]
MSRVAIIGPGRVGTAVALGLQHAGHTIVAVAGSSDPPLDSTRSGPNPHMRGSGPDRATISASLARFRRLLPDVPVTAATAAPADADLVVVATPDDALAQVAGQIALAEAVQPGQRWVHLAGAHGPEVLGPITAAGGRVAACHPAMTFPDPQTGFERLPGTSWAVTADPDDLDWARLLVVDLRGSPVTVAGSNRTLYHAGLAVGSNGTTAVVTMARDLLLGAGIDDPSAFLTPLVAASAEGGATSGVAALTGPIRRGDEATVAGHLQELRTSFPEAVQSYVALGRLILGHAARAGLADDRIAAVRTVLDRATHPR